MAVDLHNRDHSLLFPSQYSCSCTEENTFLAGRHKPTYDQNWSPSLASSDFGSSLSSPIQSELGSTESESDQDDDYVSELTRQMAHHMLQDDDAHDKHEKTWSFSGWPQSTVWSGLGSSQEEEAVMMNKLDKFKIKEDQEEIRKYNMINKEKCLSTLLKTNSVPSTVRKHDDISSAEFQSKQALIDYQIKAIQFCKLKKSEQTRKQQESLYGAKQASRFKHNDPKQPIKQFQSKERAHGGKFTSHRGKRKPWANLQQQQQHRTGSEMRAVFLGDSCSRSGPGGGTGTGVFLPRGIGNTSAGSQKKPGCSVLIPARVAQALKLHFDKMGVPSRSNGVALTIQHDALSGDVSYGLQLQQKSQSPTLPAISCHQATGLPQEWTY